MKNNNEYPKIMMVSDEPITEDNPGIKKVVWAYNEFYYYPYITYPSYVQTIERLKEEKGKIRGEVGGGEYKYAKEYLNPTIELTLDEIADKFNIDVNNLKIKK